MMREVSARTAPEYLQATGRVPENTAMTARELGGGVSNVVLRVDAEGMPPLVLKQSRAQLRTQLAWFSRLDRIWIERDALRLLGGLLPEGSVPSILFEDRENYLLGLSCAPDDAEPWKARLLRGEPDLDRARDAGAILGAIHTGAAGHPALEGPTLGDRTVFDQLRIDPYYRHVSRVYPELQGVLSALIATLHEPVERTFVHADFSPKNILVHPGGLVILDFETAHAGDPAFDLGFMLAHLLLKTFRGRHLGHETDTGFARIDAFWEGYLARTGGRVDDDRARRGAIHTAACLLARFDGKSPVDYADDIDADTARRFARAALLDPDLGWPGLLAAARDLRES